MNIDNRDLFDGPLGDVQRECLAEGVPSLTPEEARLLHVLLTLKKPKFALEIGCAYGFSAGLIASALAPGGHLTTIDRYPLMIERARHNFNRMEIEDIVTLLEGDALDILPTLTTTYDFILLDAAKAQYPVFLPHILRLLKDGGLLVADDVLQYGMLDGDRLSVPRRNRTLYTRMNAFLNEIRTNPQLSTSILPIGSGVAICVKNSNYGGKLE